MQFIIENKNNVIYTRLDSEGLEKNIGQLAKEIGWTYGSGWYYIQPKQLKREDVRREMLPYWCKKEDDPIQAYLDDVNKSAILQPLVVEYIADFGINEITEDIIHNNVVNFWWGLSNEPHQIKE